ncbi:MAG: CpsB/CapC family capsule biosynthesis tyrosine phosphatase [Candidatus Promineifilaceae bacterium]|nr:CpsB/CapC family capsule biosynthesis tyrosine phosphatase [Candidatus Promineifilaceae bacterium]
MIDIHSHILPAVDDGAQDLATALEMARIGVADGLTHLFATPHHIYFTPLTRDDVADRVAALQEALDMANIPLTIIPGHEVRLYVDTLSDWSKELAGPLGHSRYVLTEPDFYVFDETTIAILHELLDRGLIPVLAHPERIIPIQENLSIIEPILARGGLVQVTSNNLVKPPAGNVRISPRIISPAARKTAFEMLQRGWVHIIASDAHDTGFRRPVLKAAVLAAAKIVGEERAMAMVTTNPQAILSDEPVAI